MTEDKTITVKLQHVDTIKRGKKFANKFKV